MENTTGSVDILPPSSSTPIDSKSSMMAAQQMQLIEGFSSMTLEKSFNIDWSLDAQNEALKSVWDDSDFYLPRNILEDETEKSALPEFNPNRHRYMFVDNGNVFVGAQSMVDGSMDLAVRVNVKELAELIEEHQPCALREVAASRPSNPRICVAWRKVDYMVHNDSTASSARQSLCSKIFSIIADPRLESKPQTLVIATGDGSQFPQLVDMALKRGWQVVLWSWNRCLSDKFRKLQTMYPTTMKINLLDQFRSTITFRAPERRDRKQAFGGQGPLMSGSYAQQPKFFRRDLCFFCRKNMSEIALLPCQHVHLCSSCFGCAAWKKCPVCQQDTVHS